jgi:hypothetical protein
MLLEKDVGCDMEVLNALLFKPVLIEKCNLLLTCALLAAAQ